MTNKAESQDPEAPLETLQQKLGQLEAVVEQLKKRRRLYQQAKEDAGYLKKKKRILELREKIADWVLNDPNLLTAFVQSHPNLSQDDLKILPMDITR